MRPMSRYLLVALAAGFMVAGQVRGGLIVLNNSNWKYLKGTVEASSPTNAWRFLSFNDASWASGPAPFYYGEPLVGTVLNDMNNGYSSLFIRQTFNIANPASIAALKLDVVVDDGFIAWINGVEVLRYNVPAGEPSRSTVASAGVEPNLQSRTISNLTGIVTAGQNVLALQGFNSALSGSSDFVLQASLASYAAESAPPTIANVSPAPGTITALNQITVTFSEPVSGLQASDLRLNGNTPSTISGVNDVYTFGFPQPPYGTVQVNWFGGHTIVDYGLNPNRFDETAPSASWQYNLVDLIPPVISALFPPAGATLRSVSQAEVTFSEDVTGVDAADLRMNGQAATNVFKVPAGPYVFQFPPPSPGLVEMTWVANPGINDLAASPNAFVPVGWSYQHDPNSGSADLVINEILVGNQTGLIDEDGEPQDWIEIYNRGANTVDLTDFSLSDDADEAGRWVFPFRNIGPGEYLIVFASGKDRRDPSAGNRFHTNFRLARGGEFLGLYAPDSPRRLVSGFSPSYPEQRNDHSFGFDSQNVLRYFATPTPGGPNGNSTILSITEPVNFSVTRGFYSNAFELYLSTPTVAGAIRYTLDGSEPTPTIGTLYTNALRITNSALVRAIAFRHNFLPSRVATHSYLFNFSAPRRALPVLNIVTATNNLIGRTGILGMGGGSRAGDGLFITNNPVTDFHNPSAHGIAWERPVSAEYIFPNDNSGFQIDCGLRVQGSDWQRPRTTPTSKFSFRLYFRGDYGEDRLNYPIFPLTSIQNYDQLVLRAGFNEQVNPFIRDEMCRRLSHDMGQVASVGNLALVLLNGGPYTNNAGLVTAYNLCERVHEEFCQSHLGGGDQWDVIGPDFAQSAEGPGIVDGDRNDFRDMLTMVWTGTAVRPVTNTASYQALGRRLDLANFVDYCLLNAYVAMGDWPANNWRAARERSTNGIWRFIVWDAEWGMGIYALSTNRDSFAFSGTGTEDAGLASVGNSEIARLYQGLRPNPEFRLLWADRIQKHFFNGGALTPQNISNRFNELGAELQPSFVPAAQMDPEIPMWARDRASIIFPQFNTYGLYGYSNALYGLFASSNAPAFNQHGGRVNAGFALSMSAPLGGNIYYTLNGDDPRVPFSGAVSNSATAYIGPFPVNQTTVVKARALLDGTNWSAVAEAEFRVESLLPTLRITEIMYNPIGGGAFEFIELENYGATPINLGDMSFVGITFSFTEGTILAPGARIVLISNANPPSFAARYPGVAVGGTFGGQLNNAGEAIVLLDATGKTVLSVTYGDSGLWPFAADGGGYSLVFANPNGDPDDPLNWRASPAQHGSPGAGDTFPADPNTVVLSEISAASTPQWIELHNRTAGTINLAGYSLTDDSDPRKLVLPTLMIAPNQYLKIDLVDLILNARGDEVLLYDPQTNLLSRTSCGLQAVGYTFSRLGTAWGLGTPTPNAANAAATLGFASSLVINEWLANAVSSDDDWVELWNNSPEPVALQGIYIGTSNALFRITSQSFIAPFAFAQLFADEDAGADHLDFRLPAATGVIVVYDTTGVEVNRVTYGAQAENVSQGRLPDGSATIQTFPGSASPGASNFVLAYTGPYLNEVMARNVSAVSNSLGRAADWVEIFNPGGAAVDLGGMMLALDAQNNPPWVFPPSSIVAAGGYLVVWCDGNLPASTSFEANLNAGQSLNGDGGGVYLFSAAGQLVNFVEYGFQLENQSIGRVGTPWRLLTTFTPGAVNGSAATLGTASTVVFNEWMADPARGSDWFELYNSATQPVDLGGLALTDDPSMGGQGKFRIAPLSFIGARGWVKFEADGDPGLGLNHVNFSLDGSGESLRLYSVVNQTNFVPITSAYFGPQAISVSEGRLPDGAATIVTFPNSATPGEGNRQLPPNVVINEVLAGSNSIELHNTSSQAANVGGWFLSNSRADYKLYRIPDGTVILAGGYLTLTPGGFSLNAAQGGEVILSVADGAGNLSGQRYHAAFGPQLAGVSFGRFSTGQGVVFVALANPTLGAANAGARVGPIVINEIMYNPLPNGIEYIELHNISGSAQSLSGWSLANAVNVTLPAFSLPSGDFMVIELQELVHGRLDNDGERIDLLMPGGILVDSIEYEDSMPWPSGDADGGGLSLQRRNPTQFGNDPFNWVVSTPTPGTTNGVGVVLPPAITVAPQSQNRLADTIVTFNVETSGGVPFDYQWRFNGQPIPGATSSNLVLNYVQLEHSGAYDVLVSNPAGVTVSPTATLEVQAPPTIVTPPLTQTVATNATVTFRVAARGSTPINYQWRFNGQPIPDATSSSYTFTGAELPHIGEYSVLVANDFGSVVSSAYLTVLVPPRFLLQPVSQTVVERDDATFRAAVEGLLPIGFRWRRAGATISNAVGLNTTILTLTNVPLTFSNTTVDCIATNAARPSGVQSTVVRIFVLPDSDSDLLPDSWETANGFPINDPANALADPDGDGQTNRDEYLAGTDPNDVNSYLRIALVNAAFTPAPTVLLSFNAASNKTYSVQYRDALNLGSWLKLMDVESRPTNRFMEVSDASPNAASRFYQLITPAQR